MNSAAELAHEFSKLEDDPFRYNETATVSLLIAAAARVELLALAEFVSTKRVQKLPSNGRCDLWICGRQLSWAFEVKQIKYRGGVHRPATILKWVEKACQAARELTHHEADKRFGLLVISLHDAEQIEAAFIKNLESIVSKVDYAWQIASGSDFTGDTFLLFKEVHKKRVAART
ncbi:hypothetical protein [Asticcacaulis sp.]|uniref:hypothetical protein n=1 Tax=Asticcacaulis sp. TaxID=1872648 RepID=UPI00261838D1|nr:hypothetical protein [Asticcacaulis sp.]